MAKSRNRKLADLIVTAGVDIAGNVTFDGGSTSADLTFADGDKANFGASSDLQIYHDGSNSYIKDAGTGDIKILADDFYVQNAAGNSTLISVLDTGKVGLGFAGSEKLATTSTGINVTGITTSDTLVLEGTGVNTTYFTGGDASVSGRQLTLSSEAAGGQNNATHRLTVPSGYGSFNVTVNAKERVKINNNGDVSFYNDASSNAVKMFWDASSERLGIGNTAPYFALHLQAPTGFNGEAKNNILAFDTTSATTGTGGGIAFGGYSNGTGGDIYHFGNIQGIKENSTAGNYASAMLFSTRAAGATPLEQMRITSGGNVGIGDKNPSALRLSVVTPTANHIGLQVVNSNTADSFGMVVKGGNDANDYTADFRKRDNTNIMRIRGDGNVGIGTTSPATQLQVAGTGILTLGISGVNGTITSPHSLILKSVGSGEVLRYYQGSAEVFGVYASGNVGIGTSSPTARLDVRRGDASGKIAEFHNNVGYGVDIGSSTAVAYISSGYNQRLDFKTDPTSGQTERMSILANGNVGIGTTNPTTDVTKFGSGAGGLSVAGGQPVVTVRSTANAQYVGYLGQVSTNTYLGAIGGGDLLIQTGTGGTEKMRITSAGKVGIGTTSVYSGATLSVAGSTVLANGNQFVIGTFGTSGLQLIGTAGGNNIIGTMGASEPLIFRTGSSERMRIGPDGYISLFRNANEYGLELKSAGTRSGLVLKKPGTDTIQGSLLMLADESLRLGTASVYNIQMYQNGNVTMPNGNVGIGVDDPDTKLEVKGTSAAPSATTQIFSVTNATGGTRLDLGVVENGYGWIQAREGSTLRNLLLNSAGGNVLVGTTDSSPHNNSSGNGVALSGGGVDVAVADGETLYLNRMGSNGRTVNFRRAGVFVSGIDVTTTAVAYNTSSDQRLKENIADADDAGSKVDAIKVRKFDWKADGQHQDYGMIAQELIEVAPEAVSAPEDPDEMMGVDYSKLVPMLIKEIQQLRSRVATLERE